MSPEIRTDAIEAIAVGHEMRLTSADQAWLVSFGVDPSWQDNPALADELAAIIATGSMRLDEPVNQTPAAHRDIMIAREQFFAFAGIPKDTLSSFREISPTLIPLDTFISSQREMSALGLDAARVINALPAALSYAPDSVRAKFDNLSALGLDAARVINAQPAAIGLAPDSVRAKMKFLTRSAELLQWQYTAQELVEAYPAILGFSTQKLRVLRRIGAYHIDKNSRRADPKQVRSSLITPLEQYIIALSAADKTSPPTNIRSLTREAGKYRRLNAAERKKQALAAAPSLGKIGVLYARYRNQ